VYKKKVFDEKSITSENSFTNNIHNMHFSKLQIISSLGLASAKMANMERMSKNLTEPRDNLRTFGTIEQILLSGYKNYGCWCYLAQEPKGKGKPVNAIDEACRRLHGG
jgi:hypothetical protein